MQVFADPLIEIALRLFLALLFAGAALSKLKSAEEFVGVVRNFRLLPEALADVVARVLPFAELALALGLMWNVTSPYALLAAAALLLVFAFAIGINLARGRTQIDCGCFRTGARQSLSWALVMRNLVLGGLAIGVAAATAPAVQAGARTASSMEVLVAVFAAVVAMVLYLAADMVGGLFQSRSKTHS